MDTQSIWDLLSSIPIGTIVAWIVVICAIITVLCTGAIKLYKAFEKYKEVKDMNEKYKRTLEQQGEQLNDISGKVDIITNGSKNQAIIFCFFQG